MAIKLRDYKRIFVIVALIGVLLSATPAISYLLPVPEGEQLSELYILGPEHMANNYPFNIVSNQEYAGYVGVENHLGSSAYYVLYVKFRGLPDSIEGTVNQEPLYEYRFSIKDGEKWEEKITFSVLRGGISADRAIITQLQINNVKFNLNERANSLSGNNGFFYEVTFELWKYDVPSNQIQYNNRAVSLQLKFTRT
jgi:uncharacterized membrane protein